jgi:hypothetical protein
MAKRGELKGNEITPPYGVDFATWARGLTEILRTSEPSLRLGSDALSTLTEQCLWPIQMPLGYLSGLRPSDNGPPGHSMALWAIRFTSPHWGISLFIWLNRGTYGLCMFQGSHSAKIRIFSQNWPKFALHTK